MTGQTNPTACAPGSYQSGTGQSACLPASPGFFVASSGATSPTACAPGTISGSGATQCSVVQSITFGALLDRALGAAPFTVSAAGGGSGNPVVFSSLTPNVCTTSGTNGATVTLAAAGTCTIAADEAGDSTYAAASQATQSFTVTGIFRAYLSKNGNDANPCTLPQPCRLLPAALTVVNDRGEIWMLDSANFNASTVNIFKSVTILAVPGALGSIVANNADAIRISGSSNSEVTLRNTVVLNLSGTGNTGIHFEQGSQLTVEGCEIYGADTGILADATGAVVTVKDSVVRDNANNGISLQGSLLALLESVSLSNNGLAGFSIGGGSYAQVLESAISGSLTGVSVTTSGGTTARLTLTATGLSANGEAIVVSSATGADAAQVVLDDVAITHNFIGITFSGTGANTVFSRLNNTLRYNNVDVVGGTLTPQGGL
jgi:hypothetical protein